eukprot:1952219-Pyramimonas_sp.AAC.1
MCRVLHQEPSRLLVAIRAPRMQCNVLVAHGPWEGKNRTPHSLAQWWNTTTRLVRTLKGDSKLLLTCLDANARMGSVTSQSVGAVDAECQNEAGECFHDFLQATD